MKKEKRNLIITEIVMVAIAIIWFIPIYYLIVTTLKGSQEATLNPLGLPRELRLDNYVNAWHFRLSGILHHISMHLKKCSIQEHLEIPFLSQQQQCY